MAFAWTKFQDFYLRLGFLKVLVGALDSSRRSAPNEALERRLKSPLFEPANRFEALWSKVHSTFEQESLFAGKLGNTKKPTTVAEALLLAANCPSLLFAITPDTSYKILDWGHDIHLIGRGNQITERSLILKSLFPEDAPERFLSGDVMAWNPFELTIREKVFFLFHLGQLDQTLVELVDRLANTDMKVLESSDAAKLLCESFLKFLEHAQPELAPRDTPAFRTARELACVIADEQGMLDKSEICSSGIQLRRVGKKGIKRPGLIRSGSVARRANKNSDHQTIPRFEQLTDLGFVAKGQADVNDRKRWRYAATDACSRWKAVRDSASGDNEFWWNGFAKAVLSAYELGSSAEDPPDTVIATYFWRAYEGMRRPVGHTPFDSIALLGLIYAAEDGIAIEIASFHRLLLRVKQESMLPEFAFFASGNEIEKMFVHLKPGFLAALSERLERHL